MRRSAPICTVCAASPRACAPGSSRCRARAAVRPTGSGPRWRAPSSRRAAKPPRAACSRSSPPRASRTCAPGIRYLRSLTRAGAPVRRPRRRRARPRCCASGSLPYERHHAVMAAPVLYGGPVSFALARLCDVLGRGDEAAELLATAQGDCDELGARPFRARVLLERGRLCARRGERRAARELLVQCAEESPTRSACRASLRRARRRRWRARPSLCAPRPRRARCRAASPRGRPDTRRRSAGRRASRAPPARASATGPCGRAP